MRLRPTRHPAALSHVHACICFTLLVDSAYSPDAPITCGEIRQCVALAGHAHKRHKHNDTRS